MGKAGTGAIAAAALVVALSITSSCTTLRRAGDWVCGNVREVQDIVSDTLGSLLGPPGNVTASIVNAVLGAGCSAFDIIVSAPADAAQDLGLMGGEGEDAPTSQPSDPGQ